jgi:hypothetical protein
MKIVCRCARIAADLLVWGGVPSAGGLVVQGTSWASSRRGHPGEVRYQPLPGSLRNSITMALNKAAMISQEPGIPWRAGGDDE